jgi:hypothetical protein
LDIKEPIGKSKKNLAGDYNRNGCTVTTSGQVFGDIWGYLAAFIASALHGGYLGAKSRLFKLPGPA